MSDLCDHRFADDESVRRIGRGLLARDLPKADWTHAVHLAACAWMITERPDIRPEQDLPALIRAYNTSVGTVNDDKQGYHETLTQLYIMGIRAFLNDCPARSLVGRVNALLAGSVGARSWPLQFYSRDHLFSVEARRTWIEPDLVKF